MHNTFCAQHLLFTTLTLLPYPFAYDQTRCSPAFRPTLSSGYLRSSSTVPTSPLDSRTRPSPPEPARRTSRKKGRGGHEGGQWVPPIRVSMLGQCWVNVEMICLTYEYKLVLLIHSTLNAHFPHESNKEWGSTTSFHAPSRKPLEESPAPPPVQSPLPSQTQHPVPRGSRDYCLGPCWEDMCGETSGGGQVWGDTCGETCWVVTGEGGDGRRATMYNRLVCVRIQ